MAPRLGKEAKMPTLASICAVLVDMGLLETNLVICVNGYHCLQL